MSASVLHDVRTPRAAALAGLDRNARMPRLLDVPGDAGAILRAEHLVVVGLGSVGLPLAEVAARLGVGSLTLVDRGLIKPESVLTHPVQPGDVGRPKALLAGERAAAVGPDTRVRVFVGPVEGLSLDAFLGATRILLATDNLAGEATVGALATHLGLPLLQASVHGPTLTAQVRALANTGAPDDPCLQCGWTEREWSDLDRGTVFSCEGAAAPGARAAAESSSIPTRSLPHLCAMAAHLAWMELTRRALGIADAAASTLVGYCGFNHRTSLSPLARDADCPADHARWALRPAPRPLAAVTPAELFGLAGQARGTPPEALSLELDAYRFATAWACGCPGGRFFRPAAMGAGAACPHCGKARAPHPFHTHAEVPGGALRGHLGRTLAELGAGAPATALVRAPGGTVLVHPPGEPGEPADEGGAR